MKRRLFFIYFSVFILIFSRFPVLSFADEGPDLTASSYILMEMETGQILVQKNADEKRSPASTTKILTAILTLENAELDDEMTASQNAIHSIRYDYVTAGIKPGEIIKMRNLMELLLITSANEAGYIIAENIAENGTVLGFADMMNDKARELGLTGSHFTNPSGVENPDHYSTAHDLAILAREAMRNDFFREVVAKTEFTMPDTSMRKGSEWNAGHLQYTNKLLKSRSKYYSAVTGIKTGYTDPAGFCLVSSAVNPDGMELIAVVLGAGSQDVVFSESQKLLEYGYANYGIQEIVKSGKYIDRVKVEDAVDAKSAELITDGDIRYVLPLDTQRLNEGLTVEKTLNEPFKAPVAKDQVLGRIDYSFEGKPIGSVNIIAKESIEKTTFAEIRDKYYEIIHDERFTLGLKIAGGLIVFFIILRFVLKSVSRRSNRRRKYNYSPRKNHYRFKDYHR